MNSHIYVCMWVCMYMISPSSVYVREPRNSNTPEAMSNPNAQILVSKTH